MRTLSQRASACGRFAVVFIALVIAGLVVGAGILLPSAVAAQGVRQSAAIADPDHKSHFRVPAGVPLPVTRKMTIGLDKSMLVEVPVDLQKTISWRIASGVRAFALGGWASGALSASVGFAAASQTVDTAVYWAHETVWRALAAPVDR